MDSLSQILKSQADQQANQNKMQTELAQMQKEIRNLKRQQVVAWESNPVNQDDRVSANASQN